MLRSLTTQKWSVCVDMSPRNVRHAPGVGASQYSCVWRFALLAAVIQACYAGVFIYHSSFVIEGQRYFCLFDDAMVSMRYAANWAEGDGLVWNPGERIEGYSNFGWTVVMGACHLLRWSPHHTVLLVQVLGDPILWGCLVATVLLARACRLTVAGLALALMAIGVHVLWRHGYYGEWLPNTYYLKATGWPLSDRLPVGIRAGLWTMVALWPPVMLAAASFLRLRSWRVLLAGTFLVSYAYNVWIGGDAWVNGYRFELPTTLGLMVLAGDGICRISRILSLPRRRAFARYGLCIVTAIAINQVRLPEWLLLRAPDGTRGNRSSMLHVIAADRIARSDATAAVMWAGAFSYFSQRQCFDLLGKCDPYIARLPVRPEVSEPGHNKFDPSYTLSVHGPDLVTEIPGIAPVELLSGYRPLAIRIDDTDVMLAVRYDSRGLHEGTPVSWAEASRIAYELRSD